MGVSARLSGLTLMVVGGIVLAAPALAFGQRAPKDKAKASPATAPAYPAKAVLNERIAELEADIAAFMQRRAEATPDTIGRLELLIDLRIVARAFLQAAVEAPSQSEVQVCATIRANNLLSAATETAAVFKTAAKPGAAQAESSAQLHALTYKLGEIKTVAQMDEVSRQVGVLLASAAGPLPAGTRDLPQMRPRVVAPTSGPATTTRPAGGAPTLAEQGARINSLAISQQLRRQLLTLVGAAGAAANDPKGAAEAASLTNTLARAVDLADGIQSGTGLESDAKIKMEQQLTDGLTLYTDARTRSAGQARVNALDDYRKTLERIRKLNLTPDLQKKLSPAFIFAQRSGDTGPKVLESIESYLQVCDKFDRRPPAGQLPPREAKLAEGLIKQFATTRAEFLADAANLGASGLAGTGPESLRIDIEAMRAAADSTESIEKLPKSVQTLLAYKPKPFGGLEKRVTTAVTALSDPKSAAHDEAAEYLAVLVRLAGYAEQVGTAEGGGGDIARDLSNEVIKNYTGGTLAAFQAKRRQIVVELANEASGLREVDTSKMAKLDEAQDLLTALREASALEAALSRADGLARWIDWGTSATQMRALLAGYQEQTAAAFVEFIDWQPGVPSKGIAKRVPRERYAALIKLIIRDIQQIQASSALPTGIVGEIGKLITPLDGQPYASERYAQYAIGLWTRLDAASEPEAVRLVADGMAERLKSGK